MGGEGHQFHAMDFLEYAYLQSGREADAQRLIDEIRAGQTPVILYTKASNHLVAAAAASA
jgi:hypothetical protein